MTHTTEKPVTPSGNHSRPVYTYIPKDELGAIPEYRNCGASCGGPIASTRVRTPTTQGTRTAAGPHPLKSKWKSSGCGAAAPTAMLVVCGCAASHLDLREVTIGIKHANTLGGCPPGRVAGVGMRRAHGLCLPRACVDYRI